MSAAPRVSFLVPCYDQGQWLDEAVDSILAQTYQDFEIVVVNDGSTDEATNRLLTDYRRPRTRVVQSPNRGLAGARNLALAEARGELVCALDADDRLDPRFLEKTVAVLDADPSLTFCSCFQRMFGEQSWDWCRTRWQLDALLLEDTILTASPTQREAVLAVGGWDESMRRGYEDWDLWISLVERGARGHVVPEVLHHYRRKAGSMSERCGGEVHLDLFRHLVEKHRASYERHLPSVLAGRDEEAAAELRHHRNLARELALHLDPQVAGLQAELERLRGRRAAVEQGRRTVVAQPSAPSAAASTSADAPPETPALAAELAAARYEVQALRRSWSWRITAPLRAVYRWVSGASG